MRTILTSEDIKNIVERIFNGNLKEKYINSSFEYVNPNSEKIYFVNEDDGESEQKDLAEYLNIKFYSWKERVVSKSDYSIEDEPDMSLYDTWVNSLDFSLNEAYALVELTDEEVTASQDIDNATKLGTITFLMQTNKIKNLDYYINKIRNNYMGIPQEIQNSFGDIIKAYILLGTLMYDEAPQTTQVGEIIKVSCNFRISYLTNALSYTDTKFEISFSGDDLYNENGEIVNAGGEPTTTKYFEMPLTKITWQDIFDDNPLPYAERPDLTGFQATTISTIKTFSFFDFNKTLTLYINDLFWTLGAIKIDGQTAPVLDVNIPVFIRVTSNGHFYVYKDMISQLEKVLANSDFNISSITLKGWGKNLQ